MDKYWVKPYTRRDGTPVRGHQRRYPSGKATAVSAPTLFALLVFVIWLATH